MASNESRRSNTDAAGSDKESATPFSLPEPLFLPHSSPIGLENIILDRDIDFGNEKGALKKNKIAWSLQEKTVLATSWVSISTYPVIGNAQKMEAL